VTRPDGEVLRATGLDTAVWAVIALAWAVLFGGVTLWLAVSIGRYLHSGEGVSVKVAGLALFSLLSTGFMTSVVSNNLIFSVRFGDGEVAYRDGLRLHRVPAAAIDAVCFLDDIKGVRFIALRARDDVHFIASQLWSRKDFDHLQSRFWTWGADGHPGVKFSEDSISKPKGAAGVWCGEKQRDRRAWRTLPICLAIWAGLALPAFCIGLIV
jgi:hypothetical protein